MIMLKNELVFCYRFEYSFLLFLLLLPTVSMYNSTFTSNTYVEVQEKADVIWKIKRYHLVKDYKERSFLPPPYTALLLPYIYNCWQCLLRNRAYSIIGKLVNC